MLCSALTHRTAGSVQATRAGAGCVAGQAGDESGIGDTADKHQRVGAFECPAEPLAEFGVKVGRVHRDSIHRGQAGSGRTEPESFAF
jgi:hypothetical protein